MNESYCLFTLRAKMRRRIEVRCMERIIRISNKWSDSFRFQQTDQDSNKKEKSSLLEIVGRRLELFHQLIKSNPSLRALMEKSNENLCVVTLKLRDSA